MDIKVKAALETFLETFASLEGVSAKEELSQLKDVFDLELDFLGKVEAMDRVFDNRPELEALREITFDLLLINFFAEDSKKLDEDYLESSDWEKIEDQTIERGTETLNLLLYLKECEDEDITPSLEDYLKEFLLVDEDEFQDEHRIYEDVIAHQLLMESSLDEIARVSKRLSQDSEMKELFFPLMAFFYNIEPEKADIEKFKNLSEDAPFDAAVLQMIVTYNQTSPN